MITVRDATYQILRQHGMTTVFGNPGSNELPFLKGFPPDFRYVLGLHEGVVVGMADGFAQASGLPGLVNLHSAAGTGNGMGALANAWNSHTPLVVTAGQQVRNTLSLEPMLANVEAANLPRPLVKWSSEPACAEEVPSAFSRAIHMAQAPAKGPVYLSIPYDDWDREASRGVDHLWGRSVSHGGHLSAQQVARLAERLDEARNPVLVLGPDVDACKANDEVVELAERLRCPVWIAPSAPRCPFPTSHACFRGVLPSGMASVSRLLEGHDLILVVGAPVFRYHQHEPGALLPENAELISITVDVHEASRAPVGVALVTPDLQAAVASIVRSVAQSQRAMPEARPAPVPAPLTKGWVAPEALFDIVGRDAPSDAIFVNESTSTMGALWARLKMTLPGSYFFAAAGGLGFGMPAAVGVQLACPNRRVIALIGDGSANYGITALWTAAQYRIPVVFVVLKNGTYGALRRFAEILDVCDAPGLDVPGIDFCSLAQGYGVQSESVDDAAALETAFRKAVATGQPFLLEVVTAAEAKN